MPHGPPTLRRRQPSDRVGTGAVARQPVCVCWKGAEGSGFNLRAGHRRLEGPRHCVGTASVFVRSDSQDDHPLRRRVCSCLGAFGALGNGSQDRNGPRGAKVVPVGFHGGWGQSCRCGRFGCLRDRGQVTVAVKVRRALHAGLCRRDGNRGGQPSGLSMAVHGAPPRDWLTSLCERNSRFRRTKGGAEKPTGGQPREKGQQERCSASVPQTVHMSSIAPILNRLPRPAHSSRRRLSMMADVVSPPAVTLRVSRQHGGCRPAC